MKTVKIIRLKSASILALTLTFGMAAHSSNATPQTAAVDPIAPAVTEAPIAAREASTYLEDRRLTNGCIEVGFSKSECLCVTKVTKYETSLDDYRALVAHYTRPAKMMTQARISTDPIVPPQGGRTDMLRLIESPNFEYRCADAHRYFEANRTP